MFRHVVLLTWIEGATAEQKADVEAGLKKLPGAIPEIRRYDVGADAGIDQGNCDFVVVADFDSAEDYAVYRDHPVHRALIVETIRPILSGRAAVQFTV